MWLPRRLQAGVTTRLLLLLAVVPIFTLAFFSAAVAGEQLEDRNWIEARTANFIVRSVLSEKDTLALARNFELFRAAVDIVIKARRRQRDPVTTVIYALGKKVDFKQFGIQQEAAGVFQRGLRNNTILIHDASSLEENTPILHEYTHFLTSDRSNLLQPRWFNEGFAEHLSALRVRRNVLEIGLVAKRRRGSIGGKPWIPLANILAAADYYDAWSEDEKAMFYTQAWALVHYLLHRTDREAPFATDMQRYMQLVESGEQNITAFEQAFGTNVGLLNDEVRRHLERGKFDAFSFNIAELLPVFKANVVKLSREQVALSLAQIALGNGEHKNAGHWFEIALANELTRPRAETGLGDILKFRGEFAAAEPHFEQAVALAPGDPYIQLDMAEYWHYRATQTDRTDQRNKFFKRARRHYARVQDLDDTLPEAYAMHGQTFLMQGNYNDAIKLLEAAEVRLPSAYDVRLTLAEAYAGANRNKDAAVAARSVLIWNHANSVINKRAREILAHVDSQAEHKAAGTPSR